MIKRRPTLSAETSPRALDGRAPDVFRRGAWTRMRCYRDDEEVDFAIIGTRAGGGTLAYKVAHAGFRVVAFGAGPFWRPLEDFASDETDVMVHANHGIYGEMDQEIRCTRDRRLWQSARPSPARQTESRSCRTRKTNTACPSRS